MTANTYMKNVLKRFYKYEEDTRRLSNEEKEWFSPESEKIESTKK